MSLAQAIEAAILAIAGKAIDDAFNGSKEDALADAEFTAQLEAHRIENEHLADLELFEKWKLTHRAGGE